MGLSVPDGGKKGPKQGRTPLSHHRLILDLSGVCRKWVDESQEKGFKTYKVKVGGSEEESGGHRSRLIQILNWHKGARLRLDFNGKMTSHWVGFLKEIRDFIDYIEDPFTSSLEWKELYEDNWIQMALDQTVFENHFSDFHWRIVKLAKQNLDENWEGKVVFTSSMDHPVGIAHSYCQAQSCANPKWDHGFMSQDIYEPTVFHKALRSKGPYFCPPGGLGVGFDHLFEGVSWFPL